MRFVPTAVALAFALLATVPFAQAADAGQDSLSAQQRLHRAQAQMRQQARLAQQAPTGLYKLDIEPPQLTSFAAATSVNLNKLNENTLAVNLMVSDNVVGVSRIDVHAEPLNGHWSYADGSINASFPMKRTSATVFLNFWTSAEAGAWQITAVNVYDANNNVRHYDTAALAALGNNQFTVINPNASESTPPSLKAGKILTPVVARSTPPRGEYPYNYARVGLELRAADQGSPKASGLDYAFATLCMADGWTCIYMNGHTMTPGIKVGKLVLGTNISEYTAAGEYHLENVQLLDRQGNGDFLDRYNTDFDALFGGSATVTITE